MSMMVEKPYKLCPKVGDEQMVCVHRADGSYFGWAHTPEYAILSINSAYAEGGSKLQSQIDIMSKEIRLLASFIKANAENTASSRYCGSEHRWRDCLPEHIWPVVDSTLKK